MFGVCRFLGHQFAGGSSCWAYARSMSSGRVSSGRRTNGKSNTEIAGFQVFSSKHVDFPLPGLPEGIYR